MRQRSDAVVRDAATLAVDGGSLAAGTNSRQGNTGKPNVPRKEATMEKALENMSREELSDLVVMFAKNAIALDGVWFQAAEAAAGMDVAMEYDKTAWDRFGLTEGRRIKNLLGLGDRAGLEGLARALPLRFQSLANECTVVAEDGAVVYRVEECRVQKARAAKGLGYHPCKEVGLVEHPAFAHAIDDRLKCECLSCYPDIADSTCSCAWRFKLEE